MIMITAGKTRSPRPNPETGKVKPNPQMIINTAEKGKQTPQWAPLGTFNIRGLSGNVEAVEKIINTYKLQILAITETWMRPMDAVPLPYRTESICLAPTNQRYRGQGGITLVLQPNILYSLIEKRADRNFEN